MATDLIRRTSSVRVIHGARDLPALFSATEP